LISEINETHDEPPPKDNLSGVVLEEVSPSCGSFLKEIL
jgi:uncharacterized protein YbbK (DUF523 family)